MKITKNEMRSLEKGTIICGNPGIFILETDYCENQDGYLHYEVEVNEDGDVTEKQIGASGWITAKELLNYEI